MIKLYTTVVLSLMFSLTSCSPPIQTSSAQTADTSILSGKLVITGSSTIAPLAAELARKFEKNHPETKIDVQTGGSSRGLTDIRLGISQLGMVSRQLKLSENDVTGHLLAKDGVSLIVNNMNPIKSLTEAQIKAIYLGKIKNWKTLNSRDAEITVINKAEGRSTLEVFTDYFQLKNSEIKPNIIIGDNEQAIKLVANNINAIAYVSIGTAEYDIGIGIPIKTLPLKGIEASTKSLLSGRFPLSRELNFVTKGELTRLSQAFLDYTQHSSANATIVSFGFVPIQSR